ncbi:MAG: AMP-binding protein [Gammaproteobacteria bacterium]|nr:AMP-binding protein [Gammaproteobacteria bacterium]
MYGVTLDTSFFPATDDQPVSHCTIGRLLAQTAVSGGDAEALVEITQQGAVARRWTYHGLYRDSLKLAHALASRFEQGVHIVVWSPNSPEWVLMEYAAALAGLVIVTANPALQTGKIPEYVPRFPLFAAIRQFPVTFPRVPAHPQ